MQLSEHISYDDFIRSQKAVRSGINNAMGPTEIQNAITLCTLFLEPIWSKIGIVWISSGFRCAKLNKLVGGSATSAHMKGYAADIVISGMPTQELYLKILKIGLPFDQLIQEFDSWVHIGNAPKPRGQKLVAVREAGATKYLPFQG